MVKIDIVDKISEKAGLTNKEAAKIVKTVFDIIKKTLQREDKILISGFGNFVARNKRARRGRNPKTGVDIEITPRRILRFKSSEELKASLNKEGAVE